jgi:glycosyltransferase involved in cell wall biosynthesis
MNGGAGLAARRLASATSRFGHSEIISRESIAKSYSYSRPNPAKIISAKALSLLQSPGILSKGTLVTPLSVSFFRNLADHFLANSWDVIHVHATYNFLTLFDVAKLHNFAQRVVLTLHDERLLTGGCHYSMGCKKFTSICNHCPQVKKPFQKIVSFEHERAIGCHTDLEGMGLGVSAPSQWLISKASSSAVFSNIPISLIRNCVPDEFFKFPKLPASTRVNREPLRIGFIAKDLHNPYKGLSSLLNACAYLESKKARKIIIKLLGHGKIEPNGCEIQVLTSNSDSETGSFLEVIDVLVVPSIEDNLPNVILEGLACGKVVIGSAIGGIKEILEEFEMPTFSPGDIQGISKVISDLDISAYDREKVSSLARKKFSSEAIIKDLELFYTQRS